MFASVLFIVIAVLPANCALSIPTIEYDALNLFYLDLNGDDWIWKNELFYGPRWDFSDPSLDPCTDGLNSTWQGIVCSNTPIQCKAEECFIEKIVLTDYGLYGTITSAIGNLANLITLTASENSIFGTVPSSIGDMKALVNLDLDQNLIDGPLPNEITLLTSLNKLILANNRINGSLASSFGNLNLLTQLDLSHNLISNVLPLSFTNFINLRILSLHHNKFSQTISSTILNNLNQLKYLYLNDNQFSGLIFMSNTNDATFNFGRIFKDLIRFSFENNRFTGTLPSTIGDLTTCEHFLISNNLFNGDIPSEVYKMGRLKFLKLANNRFSHTLPNTMSSMTNMQILDISKNKFTGSFPTCIERYVVLHYFNISYNQYVNYIPNGVFDNLKRVSVFDISHNFFVGTLPTSLFNLNRMRHFDISYNAFTGSIPVEMNSMTRLFYVGLSHNKLGGVVSNNIFPLHQQQILTIFDISYNFFTGNIPENIFYLDNLMSINAASNCFHGELPESICYSQKLQNVVLSSLFDYDKCKSDDYSVYRPAMSGEIPSCMWSILNLTSVHIVGNSFTGTLSDLPSSSRLVNVSLAYNKLQGTIPTSFQKHPFQVLDLSHNMLCGEFAPEECVPSGVGADIDQVQVLMGLRRESTIQYDLSHNYISGYISNSFQSLSNLDVLKGNMFQCKVHGDMPTHDPNYQYTPCGTTVLDTSLLLVIIICILVFLMLFVIMLCNLQAPCYFNGVNILLYIPTLYNVIYNEPVNKSRASSVNALTHTNSGHPVHSLLPRVNTGGLTMPVSIPNNQPLAPSAITTTYNDTYNYLIILKKIRKILFILTLLLCILGMPIYIVLKSNIFNDDHGTEDDKLYTHQYRWLPSSMYLANINSSICILTLWLIGISYLMYAILYEWNRDKFKTVNKNIINYKRSILLQHQLMTNEGKGRSVGGDMASGSVHIQSRHSSSHAWWNVCNHAYISMEMFIFNVINLLIMICIYGVYMSCMEHQYISHQYISILQVIIASLLIIHHNAIFYFMNKYILMSIQYKLDFYFYLAIINNILVPVVCAILISPDCFYWHIFSYQKQTDQYEIPVCEEYRDIEVYDIEMCTKVVSKQLSMSYVAPVNYNHKCTSTFFNLMIPVFIYYYSLRLLYYLSIIFITANDFMLPIYSKSEFDASISGSSGGGMSEGGLDGSDGGGSASAMLSNKNSNRSSYNFSASNLSKISTQSTVMNPINSFYSYIPSIMYRDVVYRLSIYFTSRNNISLFDINTSFVFGMECILYVILYGLYYPLLGCIITLTFSVYICYMELLIGRYIHYQMTLTVADSMHLLRHKNKKKDTYNDGKKVTHHDNHQQPQEKEHLDEEQTQHLIFDNLYDKVDHELNARENLEFTCMHSTILSFKRIWLSLLLISCICTGIVCIDVASTDNSILWSTLLSFIEVSLTYVIMFILFWQCFFVNTKKKRTHLDFIKDLATLSPPEDVPVNFGGETGVQPTLKGTGDGHTAHTVRHNKPSSRQQQKHNNAYSDNITTANGESFSSPILVVAHDETSPPDKETSSSSQKRKLRA